MKDSPGFYVDVAQIVWYSFLLFFFGLILYLRREDRREGYPLEHEGTGKLQSLPGILYMPRTKYFRRYNGEGIVPKPDFIRDPPLENARRTSITPGSPYVPLVDPMLSGVGPGSFALRPQVPEHTSHGDLKIVPMRLANDYHMAPGDRDLRGFRVVGCDGRRAGVISDIWVDRAEALIRYVEVTLDDGPTVLLPITQAVVDTGRALVRVDAITAAQFANVPQLADPGQVTLDEEERICAYYGAGYLYAKRGRSEPLV